jgi:hydrogenase maturation factor
MIYLARRDLRRRCIVTGDIKVVERGAADTLFLNTAGLSVLPRGVSL